MKKQRTISDFDLTRRKDLLLVWDLRGEHPPTPLTPTQIECAIEYIEKTPPPDRTERYPFSLFALRIGIYGVEHAIQNIGELRRLYQLSVTLFGDVLNALERIGLSGRDVQDLIRTGRLPEKGESWRRQTDANDNRRGNHD